MDPNSEADSMSPGAVEESKRRLDKKLSVKEHFIGTTYTGFGWADLASSLPDGEFMARVMDRVRQRVAAETDIVKNMEAANVDIFANLTDGKIGNNVSMKLVNAPYEGEKWAGLAIEDKRQTLVVAPEGMNRREYLQWAVEGDEALIWKYVAAYHEAVHSAQFPEVSRNAVNGVLVMRLATAIMGGGIGAGGLVIEGSYASQERLMVWAGLCVIGSIAAFGKPEGERVWNKQDKIRENRLADPIGEVAAYMAAEDVGLQKPWETDRLIRILKDNPLYKDDWRQAAEMVTPRLEKEMDGLMAGVRKIRADNPGRMRAFTHAVFEEWDRDSGNDFPMHKWREVAEKATHEGEGLEEIVLKVRKKRLESESAVWRYINRDPKGADEGGRWGELEDMRKAALVEVADERVASVIKEVMQRFRAAGALGISKYEMTSLMYKGMRGGQYQIPEGESGWIEMMDKILATEAEKRGRSGMDVSTLAEEGRIKAEHRYTQLRTIVMEELEREWMEEKIDASGRTFNWKDRALYVGRKNANGERLAVDMDLRPGCDGIRLIRFDEKMRMITDGQDITDVGSLEQIVEETVSRMNNEAWELMERGLKEKKFPGWRISADDVSNGQMRIMLGLMARTKLVDRQTASEEEREEWRRRFTTMMAQMRGGR